MNEVALKVRKNADHYAHASRRALRGLCWDLARPAAERPIMVLGCSRAGTTVVYKTLSQSREIGTLNRETHDFWEDLHPLAAKDWTTHGLGVQDARGSDRDRVSRYFYAHTGHRRWVDKNNQNGLCVDYLHALFPDAVFVYVKRSPGDNLNSLIEGWGKPDEFATWSDRLPAEVAIDGGRYRRWCFFLAPGWQDYLRAPIEDVAAFQYTSINGAILDARERVPRGQWVEFFYEDIVRDPVAAFSVVFSACGLAFDDALAAHCRQVLGTPYNAFSPIALDKWRSGPNRERVERALPKVAEVSRRMGY